MQKAIGRLCFADMALNMLKTLQVTRGFRPLIVRSLPQYLWMRIINRRLNMRTEFRRKFMNSKQKLLTIYRRVFLKFLRRKSLLMFSSATRKPMQTAEELPILFLQQSFITNFAKKDSRSFSQELRLKTSLARRMNLTYLRRSTAQR